VGHFGAVYSFRSPGDDREGYGKKKWMGMTRYLYIEVEDILQQRRPSLGNGRRGSKYEPGLVEVEVVVDRCGVRSPIKASVIIRGTVTVIE
jgi:hypothetical protein